MGIVYDYDLTELLEEVGIEYRKGGKNVSAKWIGIEECPFCGASNCHLGANPKNKRYNCFACGSKGNIHKLLAASGISSNVVDEIIARINTGVITYEETETKVTSSSVEVPFSTEENEAGEIYLKQRGFNPKHLKRKYNISFGGIAGFFSYRILVPVYMNFQLVNYTGRDFTGDATLKYKSLPDEKAIIPIKNCLYNYDKCNGRCFIVEGVTDVWKIGNGTMALFGKAATETQIELIIKKNFKEIFILLDPDAETNALHLAAELKPFATVKIIFLKKQDPGSLSTEQIMLLRKQFGFK